ncbi:MAG: metal-dependent hydrolase [Pseudomonadota bacterium]
MPTIFTHAVLPIALGIGLGARRIPRRLMAAGAVAAMLPDFDVLAFKLHIAYADTFGHRGATHSIAFALLVGAAAMLLARRLRARPSVVFLFMAGSAFSHGVLDMLTNGGLGVALAWPLSNERLFLPWRLIEVSPIGMRFLSSRGWQVIQSEMLWVWLPAACMAAALVWIRAAGGARAGDPAARQ